MSFADIFFQNYFLKKKSSRNTIRMSNSLDPDQARRFVGPDLGPNCLPRLSADDTGRPRVNMNNSHLFFEDLFSLAFKECSVCEISLKRET